MMDSPHVQTKREIQAFLSAAGLRPRKRFGQHFLVDGNLMRRLVDSADIDDCDLVLEVGGGTGGLTDLLVSRAKQVLCVEVDRNLCEFLEQRFKDVSNFRLVWGDVLESKHRIARAVAERIRESATARPKASTSVVHAAPVALVANLPFQVATPLLMDLLVGFPQVRRFSFTIQTEVGVRLQAAPNCKAYGPLAILAQALCSIVVVCKLPPHTFWPRPTVDSLMMRMDVGRSPFPSFEQTARFATLVRGTFEHRRKTLRTALSYVLSDAARDHALTNIDGRRRPESLSVDEWLALFRTVDG